MSKAKKMMDIGSKMSFGNISADRRAPGGADSETRGSYSLSSLKDAEEKPEQIVRIDISYLEMAPDEWNFYPKLEGEEFLKLVKSIYEHGLLHPVVIRKQGERHVILSGHNRVRAFMHIKNELEEIRNGRNSGLLEMRDDSAIDPSEYDQIMAVIKEDITDDEAREIIIDANYVQRQLGQKLMTRSIIEKYRIIQQRRKNADDEKYKNIKTREIVAREFKLSGRHIDRYKKIESLDSRMLDEFYEGRLSLELAAKLAGLRPEVQSYISERYLKEVEKYPARTLASLKPSLCKSDIDRIMRDIRYDSDHMKISVREDGRSRSFTVEDPELMEKIKQLLIEHANDNIE